MKESKPIKVGICYDFDGTLSPCNMQDVSFIPSVNMSVKNFWSEVNKLGKEHNMDSTLAYLNYMILKAKENNISMSRKDLQNFGKDVPLYIGVDTWFKRINEYAKSKNIEVEHYIISSGIAEIIEGTKIANEFKYIFACHFIYHKNQAYSPATAVNYTNKTQHLFRINKGVLNYYENDRVNKFTPEDEKYIAFKNMIYIGDGETDVPCMKMISYQGGNSIAVFDDKKEDKHAVALKLLEQKRVDFIAPTDYQQNSKIEQIVKNIIDKIHLKKSTQ